MGCVAVAAVPVPFSPAVRSAVLTSDGFAAVITSPVVLAVVAVPVPFGAAVRSALLASDWFATVGAEMGCVTVIAGITSPIGITVCARSTTRRARDRFTVLARRALQDRGQPGCDLITAGSNSL